MCLFPTLIRNRKYVKNKKNGGKPPPVKDERTRFVPIGCGNCIECSKQKANQWKTRLLEDIRTNTNGKFITLTFSNEAITDLYIDIICKELEPPSDYELDNTIARLAVKRFRKRWTKKHKKALRHWLVTEIGHEGTENVHLHGIVWTNDLEEVEKIWKYGFVWKGTPVKHRGKTYFKNWVNEATIQYITKYIFKRDGKHSLFKPQILTTAGIGSNYTNRPDSQKNAYNGLKTLETYKTRSGTKTALPIYWRNKIYSEEQRESLWLQKLDKQERWVLGNCIDISQNEDEYYAALQRAQRINAELGYGTRETDWTKKEYEKERRQLMQAERIYNAK